MGKYLIKLNHANIIFYGFYNNFEKCNSYDISKHFLFYLTTLNLDLMK